MLVSPDPIGPVSERLDAWSDAMDLADTSTPRWSRICRRPAHSAGSDLYLLLAASRAEAPLGSWLAPASGPGRCVPAGQARKGALTFEHQPRARVERYGPAPQYGAVAS